MPRCPYKGDKVYNRVLGKHMHLVASYIADDGTEQGIYSDMLPTFVKILQGRIKDHYQNVAMINGGTGSGKSNLGVGVLKLMDPEWDLEANYCYDTIDYLDLLSNPTSRLILVDEATNVLNSLDSRDRQNNDAVKLLDMMRSFGRTSILCTPNFMAVNKRVRNDHTDFLLAIPDRPLIRSYKRRGFFELYIPIRNLWAEETYWQCAGAGIFSEMDPETKRIYEKVKAAHQIATMQRIRKRIKGDDME